MEQWKLPALPTVANVGARPSVTSEGNSEGPVPPDGVVIHSTLVDRNPPPRSAPGYRPGSRRWGWQQRRLQAKARSKDLFAIWNGGRHMHTPYSAWRAEHHDRRAMTERVARKELHGMCIPGENTISSALVGQRPVSPPRPKVGPDYWPVPLEGSEMRGPRVHLDGFWRSRADGELRGQISSCTLVWEDDGLATPLETHGHGGSIVYMSVDGDSHSAVLSEDGRLLRWSDGDVWVRDDDELERLRPCVDESQFQAIENLRSWANWTKRPVSTARLVCTSQRPVTAAASLAFPSGPGTPSIEEPATPPYPSAVTVAQLDAQSRVESLAGGDLDSSRPGSRASVALTPSDQGALSPSGVSRSGTPSRTSAPAWLNMTPMDSNSNRQNNLEVALQAAKRRATAEAAAITPRRGTAEDPGAVPRRRTADDVDTPRMTQRRGAVVSTRSNGMDSDTPRTAARRSLAASQADAVAARRSVVLDADAAQRRSSTAGLARITSGDDGDSPRVTHRKSAAMVIPVRSNAGEGAARRSLAIAQADADSAPRRSIAEAMGLRGSLAGSLDSG